MRTWGVIHSPRRVLTTAQCISVNLLKVSRTLSLNILFSVPRMFFLHAQSLFLHSHLILTHLLFCFNCTVPYQDCIQASFWKLVISYDQLLTRRTNSFVAVITVVTCTPICLLGQHVSLSLDSVLMKAGPLLAHAHYYIPGLNL